MKLGVAGACLLLACSVPVEDEGASASRASAAETTPVLSFNADWSRTTSGVVKSGGRATIHYDVARMPKCRTWYRGYPAWDIVAYYAVDGGAARYVALTKLEGTVRTPIDVTIDVPPGRDLAVWFHASDVGGCSQWDSDYERNYHFALAAGDRTYRFHPDWSTSTFGAAGDTVLLAYDPIRLWQCRASYNGMGAWDIVAHYRFDGGPEQLASLTAPENGSRVAIPARLARPSGARHLEVWFENHDRTGCRAWDSRYGANYHFDL